jgi:hypothetical protein
MKLVEMRLKICTRERCTAAKPHPFEAEQKIPYVLRTDVGLAVGGAQLGVSLIPVSRNLGGEPFDYRRATH